MGDRFRLPPSPLPPVFPIPRRRARAPKKSCHTSHVTPDRDSGIAPHRPSRAVLTCTGPADADRVGAEAARAQANAIGPAPAALPTRDQPYYP
jgi:hypothetical protein